MNIPQGVVSLDTRPQQLIDCIEIAAASLRGKGEEVCAIELFRLRIKIREGLSYEEAKPIFDEHTKTLFKGRYEHLA